ncbi:MAG: DMT family transporter [Alphaproteobacteria bacterium]|nr:DMT family transporter [Alphaproteobacteria bacterium]
MSGDVVFRQSALRGIFLMMLAVALFAMLDTVVKYLGQHYPVPGLVFARYGVHLLVMLILLAPRRGLGLLRTSRPGIQILRSLLLLGASFFFFTALQYLPLAEAAAIGFVTPFLVTAFSVPLLGEKVGIRRWSAVAAGFLGVLVIIRPGAEAFTVGAVFPLLMALCYSIYQILTRKISAHEDAIVSLFFTALVGTLVMSAVLPFAWVTPATAWHGALVVATGCLGAFGHFALIKALAHAPASVLAPFSYSQLLWVTLFGFLVFGDLPDGIAVLGMAIIIASGLYIASREAQARRQQG